MPYAGSAERAGITQEPNTNNPPNRAVGWRVRIPFEAFGVCQGQGLPRAASFAIHEIVANQIGSRVGLPFTRRRRPSGLTFCSDGGSKSSGKPW
jgi:hypothetical protein